MTDFQDISPVTHHAVCGYCKVFPFFNMMKNLSYLTYGRTQWKLDQHILVAFFGRGLEFQEDPFNYLDGTPKIRPPLDITDTDSDDEVSAMGEELTLRLLFNDSDDREQQHWLHSNGTNDFYIMFS